MPEMTGAPARRGDRLRRRRQQRDGHLLPVHRRTSGTRLIGVEAAGEGLRQRQARGLAAAPARPGVLHGNRTYLLQDDNGQIIETHSISAGPRLPRRRPRARLAEGHRPRRVRRHHRRRGARRVPSPVPHRRHHPGARIEPRRRLRDEARARRCGPTSTSWSTCPGRGDKDIGTVADLSGADFYDRPSMRGCRVKGARSRRR